jgi:hypothetical protein
LPGNRLNPPKKPGLYRCSPIIALLDGQAGPRAAAKRPAPLYLLDIAVTRGHCNKRPANMAVTQRYRTRKVLSSAQKQ